MQWSLRLLIIGVQTWFGNPLQVRSLFPVLNVECTSPTPSSVLDPRLRASFNIINKPSILNVWCVLTDFKSPGDMKFMEAFGKRLSPFIFLFLFFFFWKKKINGQPVC